MSGSSISTEINEKTKISDVCELGAEIITFKTYQKCYYNSSGCGIKIANSAKTGIFIISLLENKKITKIVVYSSKISDNTTSTLSVYVLSTNVRTYANKELKIYSSVNDESTYYQLPDIVVNKEIKDLKFQAPSNGMVMLHRIDIYTAEEESLSFLAQSGDTHYATFSSDKATFFPATSATVSTVSVSNGLLNVTALASQEGFGTSGYYVPANTGVLVASASSSADYYTLEGETLDALEDNMLKPASEAMTDGYTYYKLAYDNYDLKTGLGFYWGAANGGSFLCKDGTAYLAVPNGGGSVKGFVLDEVSDEDAIKNLDADCPSKREYIYNVAGQRVGSPSQGFYIKDGRKFVGK